MDLLVKELNCWTIHYIYCRLSKEFNRNHTTGNLHCGNITLSVKQMKAMWIASVYCVKQHIHFDWWIDAFFCSTKADFCPLQITDGAFLTESGPPVWHSKYFFVHFGFDGIQMAFCTHFRLIVLPLPNPLQPHQSQSSLSVVPCIGMPGHTYCKTLSSAIY